MPARPVVVDTKRQAASIYETFMARPHQRELAFNWSWPKRMQEVGVGQAEMYRSNKWQSNLDVFEEYKHVAEGPRLTYVVPGTLREWGDSNIRLKLHGRYCQPVSPMPKHFAILAPILGVQLRLWVPSGGGKLYIPNGDEGLYEVRYQHAYMGGAKHPKTDEPFVFVFTHSAGILMLMTGDELEIGADGLAG